MLLGCSIKITPGPTALSALRARHGSFAFDVLKDHVYQGLTKAINTPSAAVRIARRRDLEGWNPTSKGMPIAYSVEVQADTNDPVDFRRAVLLCLSAIGEELCGLGGSFQITRDTEQEQGVLAYA